MPSPFLQSIQHLRTQERVLLYGQTLSITEADADALTNYLSAEYEQERLCYPFEAPPFEGRAALWAAKTVFFACQLMLHRELDIADLEELLPDYEGEMSAAAQLSADLCLRFLPDILVHAQMLDPEDALIPNLERKLQIFHYSGIGYDLDRSTLDFQQIKQDQSLTQLYVDRIIQQKAILLAELPELKPLVLASLGMHRAYFWKALN